MAREYATYLQDCIEWGQENPLSYDEFVAELEKEGIR